MNEFEKNLEKKVIEIYKENKVEILNTYASLRIGTDNEFYLYFEYYFNNLNLNTPLTYVCFHFRTNGNTLICNFHSDKLKTLLSKENEEYLLLIKKQFDFLFYEIINSKYFKIKRLVNDTSYIFSDLIEEHLLDHKKYKNIALKKFNK